MAQRAGRFYSLTAVARDEFGVATTSPGVTIAVNMPGLAAGELVWLDDGVPQGAMTFANRDNWYWVSSNPSAILGQQAHQSIIQDGFHQHGFDSATFKLPVNGGEKLYTYVFLHLGYMPQEIMLEWKDDSGWNHRAFWSNENVSLIHPNTGGDQGSHWMGALPPHSRWVKLEVPADAASGTA
jgi:hypothetical protein